MAFLGKYSQALLWLSIFTILLFLTRSYQITELPIFTDEAIYLRWAQIAKDDANWRFISLTDGKQPSFIWLTMISMRFLEDPLLAGRVVSVFAGFLTMIGLFFLGKEIFKNKWIGLLSSFLYVLYPMALVYDRMALYDSLVGTFAVWSLFLIVLLARTLRLDVALLLGMVAGGGVLTKTNGFLSIYLLPLSLVLFDFKEKKIHSKILRWMFFTLVVIVLTYGIYSILRLSPFFHIINEKNHLFYYPLSEWITRPFQFFHGNILGLWDWLRRYITPAGVVLIVLAFLIDRKFLREKILLFLWFFLPFVGLALLGKTLYPRFIFPMTLAVLPLVAYAIFSLYQRFKNKLILVFIFGLLGMFPIRSNYFILTNFAVAPIPFADLGQYKNDWTSGEGVKEAVMFFEKEAKNKKIFVGTQGTFGLLPYALELYLVKNPNITLLGFWPTDFTLPKSVVDAREKMPTYFIFYQPCNECKSIGEPPPTWPVSLVAKYKRGIGSTYFSIYKIDK